MKNSKISPFASIIFICLFQLPIIGLAQNATGPEDSRINTVPQENWTKIDLLKFKVKQVDKEAHIHWETASEWENDYFEVQKSTDGKDFSDIGKVKGHGTCNDKHAYDLRDTRLVSGLVYYRLKQVNFDGQEAISNIIVLHAKIDAYDMTVFPNPATDFVNITAKKEFNDQVMVHISDMYGQEVLHKMYECNEQTTNLNIDIQNFETGTYLLKIHAGLEAQTFRIVKR